MSAQNPRVSSPAPTPFTGREYLALELASETKHEFVDGRIVAMAGASPPHNMLSARVAAVLSSLLGGRCVVMSSDQRVHIVPTGLYAYPDVTVARGDRRYGDERTRSLLSPTLIVEVTSDSTEDYGRGRKFVHYQAIDSLEHYVIVSHREPRIDHHVRLESGQGSPPRIRRLTRPSSLWAARFASTRSTTGLTSAKGLEAPSSAFGRAGPSPG